MIHDWLDILLHINDHLDRWLLEYGNWMNVILFAIIFIETGLVVMPFLPGDSLLFATGALCARIAGQEDAALTLTTVIPLLSFAAIAGDHSNYLIGRYAGHFALNIRIGKRKLVKESYIEQTHAFFEKYGTRAIIMARFVPIVRTFTPFVAGIGEMEFRKKFMPYDILGGILWISTMTLAGYVLGTNEWVKKHFEAVVVGIVLLSILPMVWAFIRMKFFPQQP